MASITTVDPATGNNLETYPALNVEQTLDVVGSVYAAQPGWAAMPVEERAAAMSAVGAQLRQERDELAALMTAEMGKPAAEARAEIEKCATAFDYYAQSGATLLADHPVEAGHDRSWVAFEPLGVVLAIMPWNFPFWQVARFAAPSLLAGNAAVLKHSPNVTGCALAIERVYRDAGLPPDVFRTVVVSLEETNDTTAAMLADDRIAGVSLTGSEGAGSAVAAAAGKHVKKSLLELGGSDPFVGLADADLDACVENAVKGRFVNGGQSCIAAKRFVVHTDLVDEFSRRFAAAVADLQVGDPTDPTVTIGPLARADLLDQLERQVDASVQAGATVLTGGHRIERDGSFYSPTVIAGVTLAMPVMAEETFGPVASVIAAVDDDEAVAIANHTRYGLSASVWSRDVDHALAVGRRISSGALFVNAVVASDARLPFGGVKHSGYGRELGFAGATEFTNARTYVVG